MMAFLATALERAACDLTVLRILLLCFVVGSVVVMKMSSSSRRALCDQGLLLTSSVPFRHTYCIAGEAAASSLIVGHEVLVHYVYIYIYLL